jgi:hypothetical protein
MLARLAMLRTIQSDHALSCKKFLGFYRYEQYRNGIDGISICVLSDKCRLKFFRSEAMARVSSSAWNKDQIALANSWRRQALESRKRHSFMSGRYTLRNYLLGVPIVALTTAIGTTVFASLEKSLDYRVKLAVGIASMLSAVLAAVQTLLRYGERAEKHRLTAARFGGIARAIEATLAKDDADRDPSGAAFQEWQREFRDLIEHSPDVPILAIDEKYDVSRSCDGVSLSTIVGTKHPG